jgi:hypothetical protein
MNTKAGFRKALLAAGAAGVLAACGGGELFLLAVVTPLNGVWRLDGDPAKESLQITSPQLDGQLYLSAYEVRARMFNPADLCGGQDDGSGLPLIGRYDNGRFVLRAENATNGPVCVDATVASLIRLNAAASATRAARFYENERVDVNLQEGLWVSATGSVKLKFDGPISVNNDQQQDVVACDVSTAGTTVVLDGKMAGFQTASGTKPRIASLVERGQTAARYTVVEFVDGRTLSLRNAAGQDITLTRQRETTATFCFS